ncbi:MAG: TatD family hydrolase [Spirochaetota bacterium]
MPRLIDTHCHLDLIAQQGLAITDSLQKAQEIGVDKILQIGINYQSSIDAQKIVKDYDGSIELKYSIGCHPADTIGSEEIADIQNLIVSNAQDPKLVGIGEIGLDYFHKDNTKEQINIFSEFLDLAAQEKLPVIIHSRDAAEDTYEILKSYKNKVSGVIHCFTYNAYFAQKFVELGFYISFSGIVAFKNAKDIHQAARSIPLGNILIETDSPYLSPPPNRGKRNDSSNLIHILERIKTLRDEAADKVEESIYLNSNNFLNRKAVLC